MSESFVDVKPKPKIAVILTVAYREAIAGGFEKGNIFKLAYHNETFTTDEAISLFVKSLNLDVKHADGCWDYAVYQIEVGSIPVSIGPGDSIIVYSDKYFSVHVGGGTISVIGDNVLITRE